jgi:undecaprenyl-diphosphatase
MTIQSIDTYLLLLVNRSAANASFDILMPALSLRGYLLVIPFLLAMLARASVKINESGKSYLVTAIWAILIACCAAWLAGFVEDWMKEAVARIRPCRAIEGIRLILPCPQSYSMPSGHTISSFAFAVPLFYLTSGYIHAAARWYPLALATMIAFSRIYLGVHYPTDVMTGAVLGSVIGLSLAMVYRMIGTEEQTKRGRRS